MGHNAPNNTKYTPERVQKIIAHLKDGRHITHAAILSGITLNTLYNWEKWDNEGHPDFRGFGSLMREAKAIGELKLEEMAISLCNHERKPDARTLMQILATKNREVYGEHQQIELSGKVQVTRLDVIATIDEAERGESGE